ncbi:MAG TPA: 3-oxoadipate enol-lactonase [Pseudonocardiaceae bacterium]|jgi:3-oxoadipate enol-lactonase|nr:3-oxoadipate enol-lactonase [Pseudonocardiaceae bacterium]
MSVAVNHVIDGPSDGEVVVLSGSLGSDVRMWDPQVQPLTEAGFRVVRYDHRGHGGSPVPQGPYDLADLGGDVLALLDRLGVDRVHWVGLSLGGMVGMWLAQNHPQRLGGLVLFCTSAELGPAQMWADRARLVRAEGTQAVAVAGVQRWLTDGYRAAHPDRVAHLESMVAATPAEGYASCCGAIERMDLVGGLASIAAPTLAIAGAQDPSTGPDHLRRIADAVPGARVEVLDPGAHLVSYEQPEKASQLVIDHLKGNR